MKPCKIWRGAKNSAGYGVRRVDRRVQRVHRLEWAKAYGPIPEGMCICHVCDRPACHELSHLFLGTRGDNSRDMVSKRRQALGERNANSKLTMTDVVLIRAQAENGYPMGLLALRYGVTHAAISLIKTGRTWAHI